MSRSIQQWIVYAKHHRRCFFFYEEKVLDLTEFILQHPGGKKAMANYINKDITQILFKVFPHKKEHTLKILSNYVIGTVKDKVSTKKGNENLPMRSETPKKQKKVCFHKKFVCDDENDEKSQESEPVEPKKSSASKKKSNHSNASSSSAKKQKKSVGKSNNTSIKNISQKKFEQDAKFDSPKKQKKKQKKQKESNSNSNIIDEQLDQQKPFFRVPILTVKHMNEL